MKIIKNAEQVLAALDYPFPDMEIGDGICIDAPGHSGTSINSHPARRKALAFGKKNGVKFRTTYRDGKLWIIRIA